MGNEEELHWELQTETPEEHAKRVAQTRKLDEKKIREAARAANMMTLQGLIGDQSFGFDGTKDELAKMFDCPGCKAVMTAPIIVCRYGHSNCSDCISSLNSCRVCRWKVPEIPDRNIFAEHLGEVFFIQCKYYANGCKVEMKAEDLKEHQMNCSFKYEVKEKLE